MIELLFPSWLSGVFLSIVAGPLGSFIVWRRMSYFGDALAHGSLLGIALGFIFNVNPYYTMVIIIICLAFGLAYLEYYSYLEIDALLGIMAHSFLSLGLIVVSLISNLRINLMSYLFGDLLAVTLRDVYIISIIVIAVLIIIAWQWRSLLLMSINPELAQIDGINVQRTRLILMLITALTIGVTIKFVGILIMTSLLIIPAATARRFSRSPEQMVVLAVVIGIICITGGLSVSAIYDTPAVPSIVLCGTLLFVISLFKKVIA
ncbi:zinc ABC transporter permease subunit ZnuB [Pantoea sp. Aalb]|uniref:zinc ABC transporter permease subunit ZnuB n=1 Tax=Pantoea sp. Aalb TaxID=2576762 RepID=UPI001326B8C6|nr:zinc ABC transporter permease subunit ZnuB [Pantoea sp. Aalb]MXP67363.1 zinc ABC transporter permease subunit ZnuB [Pantoea sp. Aalb]